MTKKKWTQKDIEEFVDEKFEDLGIDPDDYDLLEDYKEGVEDDN